VAIYLWHRTVRELPLLPTRWLARGRCLLKASS
jgi:hypothetical protein